MSFEHVRSALAIAYADGFLDDEEVLFRYNHYLLINPHCQSGILFCFDVNTLQIPARFKCPQGTVCSGMEGLCLQKHIFRTKIEIHL